MKSHYYSQHAVELRAELGRTISRDMLRDLHRKSGIRHLAVAVRQFAMLGLTTWGLIRLEQPLLWVPLALVQGFTIFNFTILLHEVVHHTVFARRRPRVERVLGLLYSVPSGISASQFTRWHLDHHAELGSDEDDPKRHHLSPKVNARWYKLLYCTPALFPIYFRAARREAATYPPGLQRRIAFERRLAIAAHLLALGLIWYFFGFYAALRTSIIPVFFVFPVAFTLNRLGQHYDIDPEDPAKWGTLMKGHWFWDFVYLNSNYHLEHHYFPGVPFYRLPELQRVLVPFYSRRGMRWMTYGRLVRGWLVENRAPHTDWSKTPASSDRAPLPAVSPRAR
ncbi:MAG TPA: fatty acid desaturase [Vicinamibacterales bacterium]|nr:fatty acid desaturase [Vicinamibacterales bacterium]